MKQKLSYTVSPRVMPVIRTEQLNQWFLEDSRVLCWLAAKASQSPPIRSVCSPHTPAEETSSAGLQCAAR